MRSNVFILAIVLAAPRLFGGGSHGVDLDVIVDGTRSRELFHGGTTYIEAVRGRDYSIRLTNPTPHRVAVALSVDGLNTIDAKHGDAWSAAKWVLDPYETTEISGWQVSDATARRFFFTGEGSSYGAFLGETENLGVIEAVFYRERPRPVVEYHRKQSGARSEAAPAPAAALDAQESLDDDYAATGMGERERHEVRRVHVALEREPMATIRIRYEFRPQLVKLGVLPRHERPLDRRERARGFEYCPEP